MGEGLTVQQLIDRLQEFIEEGRCAPDSKVVKHVELPLEETFEDCSSVSAGKWVDEKYEQAVPSDDPNRVVCIW